MTDAELGRKLDALLFCIGDIGPREERMRALGSTLRELVGELLESELRRIARNIIGSDIGELQLMLDERDMRLKSEIYQAFQRGRWPLPGAPETLR